MMEEQLCWVQKARPAEDAANEKVMEEDMEAVDEEKEAAAEAERLAVLVAAAPVVGRRHRPRTAAG